MWHFTLLIIVFLVILTISQLWLNSYSVEGFIDKSPGNTSPAPSVTFPFKNIKTGDAASDTNTNIIAIVAPFRNKDHRRQFEDLKQLKYKFIGISSYLQFPGTIQNEFDPANGENLAWYVDQCIGWVHCFRKPSLVFSEDRWRKLPLLQMAQSDFTDPTSIKPDRTVEKKWDFIYICLKDNDTCSPGWNSINRNWNLAQKTLLLLCGKYNLKCLVVGRIGCPIDNSIRDNVTIKSQLSYWEFIKALQASKFTFLPNIMDASPRILTESLCVNNPVLVNRNIIGGWKYVNSETGEFFTNENDVEDAYLKLSRNYNNYTPRKFFMEYYGPRASGKRLAKYLRTIYPSFTPCKEAIPYCCD